MSGIQEFLEFRVGDGIFVDIKRVRRASSVRGNDAGIFPGILHVDAGIVEAFNLDSLLP